MGKTYPSRVDWWLAVLMVLPVIGSGAALASGIAAGASVTIGIGVGSLVLYLALVFGLIYPMSYAIDADGFRLRAGLQRLHVPWDRVIKAELSRNPTSSAALSLKRINVEYRKPNGKETYVLISPPDREAFLADLVAASPRHELVDGKVVEK
jgi:hypothetical protein